MENNKKILIIEDRPESFLPLAQALKKRGYGVSGFSTGEKGLDSFNAGKPDLVILDVVLPGMDGWEVLHKIKSGMKSRTVPVIMLTEKNEAQDKIKGYDLGADYYISKPYDLNNVLRIIEAALRRD